MGAGLGDAGTGKTKWSRHGEMQGQASLECGGLGQVWVMGEWDGWGERDRKRKFRNEGRMFKGKIVTINGLRLMLRALVRAVCS